MRHLYALVIASLLAAPVTAQTLHGHPQAPAYSAAVPRPSVSFQGHWPNLDPTHTCHLHLDTLDFPYGAELNGTPFPVKVALKLFMCDGSIGAFWGDSFVTVTWDDGRTSAPIVQGNPMQLVTRTGTVLIDPKQGRFAHLHGWTGVPFNARVGFANKDEMTVQGITSFFSIIDPAAPEVAPPGNFGPVLSSRVDIASAATHVAFGTMITELESWIPVLPISAPWTSTLAVYNYANGNDDPLANGRFEQRFNIDLHSGVRGVLADSGNANKLGFTDRPVTFDPVAMGPGPHNVAFFWTQTVAPETVSSLVVVNVPVTGGAPLLCTDPLATNVGQPLPCVFPVPVTWVTFPATFQRFGTQDRYRICDVAGHCVELAVKP